MRYRKRKQNKPSRVTIIVLFLIAVGLYAWRTIGITEPVEALARAIKLRNSSDPSHLHPLLKITASDKRVSHWAKLIEAELLVAQDKHQLAKKKYASIGPQSAASLDARLGLLKLNTPDNPVEVFEEIESLRTAVRDAERKDLSHKLDFIAANLYEKSGAPKRAAALYRKIRQQLPPSPILNEAITAEESLYNRFPALHPGKKFESLIDEVQLLLRQKEYAAALAFLQHTTELSEISPQEAFQAKQLEEKLLRRLKRHEEADRLLLVISADGPLGIADAAMLQTAKNAWNIDDRHRALQLLDSLRERFPNSNLLDKANYFEARILEELNQLPEAKAIYESLAKSSSDRLLQLRGLHRLAWLYLRSDKFLMAAKHFERLRTTSDEILSAPNSTSKTEVYEELHHAYYWQAFALSKVSQSELTNARYHNDLAAQLLRQLSTKSPPSYYTQLAKSSNTLFKQGAVQEPPPEDNTAPCFVPVSPKLKETLELLKSEKLLDFVQHEINWHFYKKFNSSTRHPTATASERNIRHELTRLSLHNEFTSAHLTIKLARRLFNGYLESTILSETDKECLPALENFLFPRAFVSSFEKYAKQSAIPRRLLLSLGHTESHFDPQAVSRVGARGLLQLMPNTAKQEGLKPNETLDNPDTNIRLGAKHLARLIREYDGEKTYAIAAYNSGGGAVNRWRTQFPDLSTKQWIEMIGYPETKRYVKKVLFAEGMYKKLE